MRVLSPAALAVSRQGRVLLQGGTGDSAHRAAAAGPAGASHSGHAISINGACQTFCRFIHAAGRGLVTARIALLLPDQTEFLGGPPASRMCKTSAQISEHLENAIRLQAWRCRI